MAGIETGDFPSKVLVVDDESVILQLLTTALSAENLPLRTVLTAEEAERALAAEEFGCLLVDKNLPGMDGIELLRRTRKLQPHCACLMMTGYASIDSAVEALRLGAADYLQKPFPSLQLVAEKVRLALENARAQFEAELRMRDAAIARRRTEIEVFNDVLEARVAAANADLKRRCEMLSDQLARNIGTDRGARLSAEMVLPTATELESRR